MVWAGCSVEKHYDILSFFFDGVPTPAELRMASETGKPLILRDSATYTIHEPFETGQCEACHGSSFQRDTVVTSAVCADCHDHVSGEHRFMHAAVVVGACLWCHEPHESAYSYLFKLEPREVCFQCHDMWVGFDVKTPEHTDETQSCLECHSGHGSTESNLLHASAQKGAEPED